MMRVQIMRCALGALLLSSVGCGNLLGGLEQGDTNSHPPAIPPTAVAFDAGLEEEDAGRYPGPSQGFADGGVTYLELDAAAPPIPEKPPQAWYFDASLPSLPGKPCGHEGDAALPPSQDPSACTESVLKSPDGSCIGYDLIKAELTKQCEATGQVLSAIHMEDDQTCPGGALYVSGVCCPLEPTAPSACSGGVLGDGKTCMDYATIKEQASAACAARGASLTDLTSEQDGCTSGSALTKYTCCGAQESGPKVLF